MIHLDNDMENDRLGEVRKKIMSLRHINEDFRFSLIIFISSIDLSDKKIKTFLNFKDNKIAIGLIFRLVISNAFKYGVPTIYIQQCLDYKKLYHDACKSKYIKRSEDELFRDKTRMETSYKNLITATLQLIRSKNSRKEKISKVLEKIADKNN